jgi:hypothetical protein
MEGAGVEDLDPGFLHDAAAVLGLGEEYLLEDGEELAGALADMALTGDSLQKFESPYWPVDGCKKTDGCVSVALRDCDQGVLDLLVKILQCVTSPPFTPTTLLSR